MTSHKKPSKKDGKPRIFGPGNILREQVDHQEQTIDQLFSVMAKYLPKEGQEEIAHLHTRYKEHSTNLKNQYALDVFNGCGEHATLDHYLLYKNNQTDQEVEPVFPSPGHEGNFYQRFQSCLETHVLRRIKELRLRGAGRTTLSEDADLTEQESDIYRLEDGELALVLNTTESCGMWPLNQPNELVASPLSKFFTRTNLERMLNELFYVVNIRYRLDVEGETPLTEDHIHEQLAAHLGPPFCTQTTDRRRFLIASPMRDPMIEYERLDGEVMGLRFQHIPGLHQPIPHLVFRLTEDGFVSFSVEHGVTFYHYSHSEGIMVTIKDHVPYIPSRLFDEAFSMFLQTLDK